MSALAYYLSLPLLYLIAVLPPFLRYGVADFFFLLVYYVIGYRKKVVYTNLRNSFPEKSETEIKRIERRFYRYFCDLMAETATTLTISPKQLRKQVTFKNIEVFEKYHRQNQSIIIAMGHWGNWELGGARFAIEPLHKLNVIYHPLANKHFNKLIVHMRTRLGNGLYAMKDTLRGMIRDKNELTATAFIADQTPSPKGAYWTTFLNQDTPVFTGTGRIAVKFKYPVVYAGVYRTSRGKYEIQLIDLVPDPGNVSENEVLDRFNRQLEADIRRQPETWLWSHRRWKHKRPTS